MLVLIGAYGRPHDFLPVASEPVSMCYAGQAAPERSERYERIAQMNIEVLSPCMPERKPDAASKAPTADAVRYTVNPCLGLIMHQQYSRQASS